MSVQDIAGKIVGLIPDGDSGTGCFLNRFADLLEQAAGSDDLELLRTGVDAENLEIGLREFASAFPSDVITFDDGETYSAFLGLARLDRETRSNALMRVANFYRAKEE